MPPSIGLDRDAANAYSTGSGPEGESRLRLDLSVLIPVFNEVDNVGPLHAELDAVLRPLTLSYELIFVDDGSTDGTAARLEAIQASDPEHVRVVFLWRNCGQTAALSAALDLARGEILVPMDGDRQNDPADIPRLLETLEKGHDVVSGLEAQPPRCAPEPQDPVANRQPSDCPDFTACRCTTSAAR